MTKIILSPEHAAQIGREIERDAECMPPGPVKDSAHQLAHRFMYNDGRNIVIKYEKAAA